MNKFRDRYKKRIRMDEPKIRSVVKRRFTSTLRDIILEDMRKQTKKINSMIWHITEPSKNYDGIISKIKTFER